MSDGAPPIEEMLEFTKKHTAVTTNEVVVAAPGASERYIIDSLWFSGDTAGTLQIVDSDNTAINGYFFAIPAGGTVNLNGKALKQLARQKGFKYTQTGGGNYSVGFKYYKRQEIPTT